MLGRTNTGGGGGGCLNFKVICNPQPSTAKENTIWVDTDKINNYYFSAARPENMVDYDVWFPTGTAGNAEFDALKKNGIQVYPLSAKQYISGALVDKEAKIYQSGAWSDLIASPFYYGKQKYKWGAKARLVRTTWNARAVGVKINSDGSVTLSQAITKDKGYEGTYELSEPYDLTNINTLELISANRTSGEQVVFFTAYNNVIDGSITGVYQNKTVLDVSSLYGEHIIGVALSSNGWGDKTGSESIMILEVNAK